MSSVESGAPLRILHVVRAMNRGGIETWLMHLLRHMDRNQFRIDFAVDTLNPADYNEEIRALGGNLVCYTNPHYPWSFARSFLRILHERGPYDVVHSHLHHFNGYVLRLASRAGVPARIAHSHANFSAEDAGAALPRKFYLKLMKRWINRYSTCRIAASHHAGTALFGRDEKTNLLPWRVLFCAVDLKPFRKVTDSSAVRRELGIPLEALVLGHVGRFAKEKNHTFLVEIFAHVIRRQPCSYLLLVGDGELRSAIERQVKQSSLEKRVVFAGVRSDVPRLMQGAMDLFVFPSLHEGLGLVGIEAQAAGLPCFFSDTIPPETTVVPDLVHRLGITRPEAWADKILAAARVSARVSRPDALTLVERSPFNVRNGTQVLEQIYR